MLMTKIKLPSVKIQSQFKRHNLLSIEKIKQSVLEALEDVKAFDILDMDVRRITTVADFMIIASANSTRQTRALANNVQVKMKDINIDILGVEGEEEGDWVLVDIGDSIVHIMTPTTRAYFNLEELWSDPLV